MANSAFPNGRHLDLGGLACTVPTPVTHELLMHTTIRHVRTQNCRDGRSRGPIVVHKTKLVTPTTSSDVECNRGERELILKFAALTLSFCMEQIRLGMGPETGDQSVT